MKIIMYFCTFWCCWRGEKNMVNHKGKQKEKALAGVTLHQRVKKVEKKMLIISTENTLKSPFSLTTQTIIQTFPFIQPFDVFQVLLARLFLYYSPFPSCQSKSDGIQTMWSSLFNSYIDVKSMKRFASLSMWKVVGLVGFVSGDVTYMSSQNRF